jgi:succinate-semialdehyde dehydrogenase/glutarate-semialdehyde dehydrogenase
MRHVAEATSAGATIVIGDQVDKIMGPNYFPATVLKPDMLLCQEETFRPLAALIPFSTEEEVIQLANDADVCLAGYFYTYNISRL